MREEIPQGASKMTTSVHCFHKSIRRTTAIAFTLQAVTTTERERPSWYSWDTWHISFGVTLSVPSSTPGKRREGASMYRVVINVRRQCMPKVYHSTIGVASHYVERLVLACHWIGQGRYNMVSVFATLSRNRGRGRGVRHKSK